MSRLLPLVVLCSCTAAQPQQHKTSLEDWLDAWVEVRTCVVSNAKDTSSGIVVSRLLGRQCTEQLRRLEVLSNSDFEPMVGMWQRALENYEDPASLAAAIDRIDHSAVVVGLATAHPIPPRAREVEFESLAVPWKPFEYVPGRTSFNGSPVAQVGRDRYAVVERFGVTRIVEHDRHEVLALPSHDVTVPDDALYATAVGDDLLVVKWPAEDERYAYAVEYTHDGGRSWKRELMFPNGRLAGDWQDPVTGEITLLVNQDDVRYLQHLTSAGPKPWQRTTAPDRFWLKSCLSDGRAWGLYGELLMSMTTGAQIGLTGPGNNPALACRGANAVVLRHDPEAIERCDSTRCREVFKLPFQPSIDPYLTRGVIGVLEDGRWIYALAYWPLLAVWVEGVPGPIFWKVPSAPPLHFQGIAVVGGNPALVGKTLTNRAYLVALPIK